MLAGSAAEGDDDLLVKFVDEDALTYDEIKKGLKTAFTSNRIVPVLCERVIQSSGLTALLDFIAEIGLEPGDALEAAVAPDGERASVKVSAEGSFSALCVKTVNDQFSGRISSYLKIITGALKPDTEILNLDRARKEKIGKLYRCTGKS